MNFLKVGRVTNIVFVLKSCSLLERDIIRLNLSHYMFHDLIKHKKALQ